MAEAPEWAVVVLDSVAVSFTIQPLVPASAPGLLSSSTPISDSSSWGVSGIVQLWSW